MGVRGLEDAVAQRRGEEGLMSDPELKAMGTIAQALADLSEEQRRNVLLYVNARYGGQIAPRRSPINSQVATNVNVAQYETVGDFFDAVNPQTEADRVLAVSYWLQVVEQRTEIEAFEINKHLKNLGHTVSNITRALDSLIAQTPRLALQTSKSGSSKQARKKYKVTREGIKRMQSILAESNGDDKGG